QYYESIPEDSLPIINTEVEVAQLILEPPVSEVARNYAKEQLEDLRARILRGESFERLAKAYSMDPGSKNNGGLLPEFGRGEMVGAFERMAFKLKEDSLSPVFQSDYGFNIMKLIKRNGDRIIAAHILIRPEYTSNDFIRASALADSLFAELSAGRMEWCTAVKGFTSETYGDKAYCGFLSDEVTGLQKTSFDELPTDIKQMVEKMDAGQYSAPKLTVTPDGRSVYRILYVKSFIAPHEANLIQDYSRIQMEAENQKKQEALDAWVDKFKARTYIRVNDPGFDCPSMQEWNHP
ncbi:MAG: peptidylprolyl isomerase, partial [Bacteroidia bacterium]